MRNHLRSVVLRSVVLAATLVSTASTFASADAPAALRITAEKLAGGFTDPLFAAAPPGDTSRLFIVQQTGQILIVSLPSGTVNPTPFLDIHSRLVSGGEQGLLGLAFDPDYASNGRFYVNYTAPGGAFGAGITRVSRFNLTADPDIADPASEKIVLSFDQPQTNHNGGWIGFSPRNGDDHNLYIATGDGGNFDDQGPGHIEPGGNAQSTKTLLGKMLRIHIEDSGSYTIPPNNPFAGSPTEKQEIFCFGLRNPFRCSFDRKTGDLWLGDVGQATREEVDLQPASNPSGGENYGWRVREGFIQNPAYPNDPPPPDAVDPIVDYTHTATGQTVIGGYIYRGSAIRGLRGLYVFADYLGPISGDFTGTVLIFGYGGSGVPKIHDATSLLFPTQVGGLDLANPTSLGEDATGELYIVDYSAGNIFKIVPRSR
jgi:glucose/arabinose dehydrogenase